MKYGLFFVQKGVLFTKECIKQFGEVRKFLSKLCISPLTRFAFSYPRGATFKLLPCLRGAATKWLREGSILRMTFCCVLYRLLVAG